VRIFNQKCIFNKNLNSYKAESILHFCRKEFNSSKHGSNQSVCCWQRNWGVMRILRVAVMKLNVQTEKISKIYQFLTKQCSQLWIVYNYKLINTALNQFVKHNKCLSKYNHVKYTTEKNCIKWLLIIVRRNIWWLKNWMIYITRCTCFPGWFPCNFSYIMQPCFCSVFEDNLFFSTEIAEQTSLYIQQWFFFACSIIKQSKKQKLRGFSPQSELYRLSDRSLSAKLVPTFSG
jgi:hypothetical protein